MLSTPPLQIQTLLVDDLYQLLGLFFRENLAIIIIIIAIGVHVLKKKKAR